VPSLWVAGAIHNKVIHSFRVAYAQAKRHRTTIYRLFSTTGAIQSTNEPSVSRYRNRENLWKTGTEVCIRTTSTA
jgi:hypothetical protein